MTSSLNFNIQNCHVLFLNLFWQDFVYFPWRIPFLHRMQTSKKINDIDNKTFTSYFSDYQQQTLLLSFIL